MSFSLWYLLHQTTDHGSQSFFGMHLFDPRDVVDASRTPFIIPFVVLSVGTYIAATSGLLFVRDWTSIKDWIVGRTLEEPARLDQGLPY